MRLPSKDDPGGDIEGRLPLDYVLEVMRRNQIDTIKEAEYADGTVLYSLISDDHAESQAMPDPVGGLQMRYLIRKFDLDPLEFYPFRRLDSQPSARIMH